jgi:hypothetical protein
MTFHEKECAIAALGLLIERAQSRREKQELTKWLREIIQTPLETDLQAPSPY